MNRKEVWNMSAEEMDKAVVEEVLKGELCNHSLRIDGELMRDEFYPSIDLSDAWAVVYTLNRAVEGSRKAPNEFYNFLIHPNNQGIWDKSEAEAAFDLCAYALIAVMEAE